MLNQEFYDNALKTLQQLSPEIQEYQFPHLRLFTDGDEFYQKLWQMIDESKTYCWILTYAMDKSLAANITLYKLINAQQRGVNVVLFVDDLQGHYNNKLTKLFQSYGGVFLNLNPLSAFKIYGQEFFRRHHEKMAVADHKAIFGTSNIESHYGGVKWGKQTFHDINTYTEGRHLSYNLQKHFMYLASLYKIQLNPHKPTPNEDLLYTFNAFPPYYEFFKTHPPFNRQIQTQIIESIKNAKDNIKIVQAYYYSVRIFEKHLREAMDRGVKVEIITADKRDQPVYRYAFNRILFQGVIHRNLKVYEFPEQLLHMKGYVFDNNQLFYGSFNNDRWSWKLNHEFNILTEDENEIKMFMDIYNETKLRTRQIDYKKTGTPLRWIKMKFWEWFIYQSEILMSKNQGYHPNKYKYNNLLNTWDDGIGNYF
ncbi:unnamed protein product [Paramecium pentaurelia]|uniref:PLD phosphodiesterase domain-containing protein n=1 Tax=Paramecium pentaurelia TaxID=43138 RepID=A0A8S1WC91_9CILI|nr:unnamed protein product [Paramecium pentaurelia]